MVRSQHTPVRDHRVHARDLIAVVEQVIEQPATGMCGRPRCGSS